MANVPLTTYTPLEVKFAWTLEGWRNSPAYVFSKKLGRVFGRIHSPELYGEGGTVWQFIIEFQELQDDDEAKAILRFVCIKEPKHEPTEECAVEGSVSLTSVENENFQKKYCVLGALSPESQLPNVYQYMDIYCAPDSLTLTANFTIYGCRQTSRIDVEDTPELSSLVPCLKKLYEDSEFTDLTIVVDDNEVPAHRALLAARSSVLKAMLSTNMREKEEAKIVMTDATYESWRLFQKFLYTDVFNPPEPCDMSCLLEVLIISDKYQVLQLKHRVGKVILSRLTPENVLETYDALENLAVPGLQEAASEVVLANWETMRRDRRVLAWMAAGSELATNLFENLRFYERKTVVTFLNI